MTRACAAVVVVGATLLASATAAQTPATRDTWRIFEGSWSATGPRTALPTEAGRDAVVVHLSGALVLTEPGGLSRGFRAIVIAFTDGEREGVGRSLWTDERGDRIYGTVRAAPIAAGGQFTGTLTGGTGRYAGITGTYSFTWQYVVDADNGTIQGRTSGLKGRFQQRAMEP